MTIADLETLGPGQPEEAPTEVAAKAIVGKSPTRIALERLRSDKNAVICASIVAVLVILGVFAPLICKMWGIIPDDAPNHGSTGDFISVGYPTIGPPYYPFTWAHPLGLAPGTAYDNLARLLYGLRTSLFIATTATLATTVIGVTVGLIAGFARGTTDRVIGFITDVFLSFPFLLGALALSPIITARFADQPGALKWAQIIALLAVLIVLGWMPWLA